MSKISMKTIPVSQAVGTVLCHDITRIEPGVQKGPVFRKGHVVREEDIPVLLSVGKENLYVYEPLPGQVHENDAAVRIGNVAAGQNIEFSEIKEGRINFLAAEHGLLRVDEAGGYSNLTLDRALRKANLPPRDAALATTLF